MEEHIPFGHLGQLGHLDIWDIYDIWDIKVIKIYEKQSSCLRFKTMYKKLVNGCSCAYNSFA